MIARQRQCGLTLVEVLVSVVLLAILLIPAISALQTGITGAEVHADVATNHYRLRARLDELLAEPFADVTADPFTGTDPDLVWMRVDIEDSVFTLQTVRARGY